MNEKTPDYTDLSLEDLEHIGGGWKDEDLLPEELEHRKALLKLIFDLKKMDSSERNRESEEKAYHAYRDYCAYLDRKYGK